MSNKPLSKLQRARKLHQAGRLAEARPLYEKILELNEGDPDALNFLGFLRYQQGDVHKGVELISKAITRNPEYVDAYLNLGNILLKLNEINETYACYSRAYELAPHRYETLTNFGILLKHMGEFGHSEDLLKQAVAIHPDVAVGYYNLANTQMARGNHGDAIENCKICLERSPDFTPVYSSFTRACYHAGRSAEAAEVYRIQLKRSPDNPVLIHLLAAVSGENVPARASQDYVRRTFDSYAARFDQSLMSLEYKGPELTAAALEAHVDPDSKLAILDACCGTGLCAQHLKPYAALLTGVDISSGMLDKARSRDLYDELICDDVEAYLGSASDRFDLIVSMDALIYVGDLSNVFHGITQALKPGGLTMFSLEQPTENISADQGYGLAPHGRFVHQRDYVSALLQSHGLEIAELRHCVPRQELKQDVSGWMCVARKV